MAASVSNRSAGPPGFISDHNNPISPPTQTSRPCRYHTEPLVSSGNPRGLLLCHLRPREKRKPSILTSQQRIEWKIKKLPSRRFPSQWKQRKLPIPLCLSAPLVYQWATCCESQRSAGSCILPVVSCFYYLFWDLKTTAVSGSKIHAGKLLMP